VLSIVVGRVAALSGVGRAEVASAGRAWTVSGRSCQIIGTATALHTSAPSFVRMSRSSAS